MTFVRPPEVSLDNSAPFANDALERSDFATAVTELIRWAPTPCVFNLDASWGQGKTTFLRMWRASVAAQNGCTVYLNAWETDFSSDPLLALLGELESQIAAQNDLPPTVAEKLAKMKKIGGRLLKAAVPAALKAATMGVLDLTEATEEALGAFAEKAADEELKNYEARRESMTGFRETLSDLAHTLQSTDDSTSPPLPLVVVVDELDRCRPDYAIRVLETVKHLFNVPHVAFLIATDVVQLSSSVRHAYGSDIDCGSYLRRFFDLTIRLPKPNTKSFVRAQFNRFGLEDFFSARTHHELQYDREHVEASFTGLFDATASTLRDQERCFALLVLAVRATRSNQYLHPLLLCPLIILRVKNPALYAKLSTGRAKAGEITAYFSESEEGRAFFNKRGYGNAIEALLIRVLKDEEVAEHYKRVAESETSGPERERARRIVELFDDHHLVNRLPSLETCLTKLDFAASIAENH